MIKNEKGFSLVELITTCVILCVSLGLVAVIVYTFNTNTELHTISKQVLSDLRYSQEIAMSQRREVDVLINLGSNQYEAKWHDDGSYIPLPTDDSKNLKINFNNSQYKNISITNTQITGRFSFCPLGKPNIDGAVIGSQMTMMTLNSKRSIVIFPTGLTAIE
jgi:Tfp pilus assembly protein FimT